MLPARLVAREVSEYAPKPVKICDLSPTNPIIAFRNTQV